MIGQKRPQAAPKLLPRTVACLEALAKQRIEKGLSRVMSILGHCWGTELKLDIRWTHRKWSCPPHMGTSSELGA